MNYLVYKLSFLTPVHIGHSEGTSGLESSMISIRSDTLFSALFIEALKKNMNELLFDAVINDKLIFSDLFPYSDKDLFLPKPLLKPSGDKHDELSSDRKKMKKLKFIHACSFDKYIGYILDKVDYSPDDSASDLKSVADISIKTQVSLKGLEESAPYRVGITTFRENCGLYLLCGFEDDGRRELFEGLLESLSYSGIGGKRSSGLGKFEIISVSSPDNPPKESKSTYDTISRLINSTSKVSVLLNTALPSNDELKVALEGARYKLIRRGGFVQSSDYAPTFRKKTDLYVFESGSCFDSRFKGSIPDISSNGSHPVFRMLKPFFGGIDL
ncbi:MAG: type III-A CRISPR-associated RAMP protein Csm4 [Saccharofermentanales bacterium]